jgi:hypothetical protein
MEDELGAMAAYSMLLSKEFKCQGDLRKTWRAFFRTRDETAGLGQNKPHPVSLLPAGAEFVQGGGVGVLLGGEEAVQGHRVMEAF